MLVALAARACSDWHMQLSVMTCVDLCVVLLMLHVEPRLDDIPNPLP
jgi:hypothetical protein